MEFHNGLSKSLGYELHCGVLSYNIFSEINKNTMVATHALAGAGLGDWESHAKNDTGSS